MSARKQRGLASGGPAQHRATVRRAAIARRCAPCLALGLLSACAGGSGLRPGASASASLECAPYAREVSGIQLYGDAASWWDEAAGRYDRAAAPSPGAVLVFRRTARLPHGHVSVVVTTQDGPREITVTQANWVHGRIARQEPVVDVSPGNDWTAVRVWWAPSGALGTTSYPTYGFIAPGLIAPGLIAPVAGPGWHPDVVASR